MFKIVKLVPRLGALEPQIDITKIIEMRAYNTEEAAVWLSDDSPGDTDTISELEYLAVYRAGKLRTNNKSIIKADGFDTAIVTAEVHPDLTEVTFYHADTDEPIATVPVDQVTHTATLQVTATTPGIIRIRAGEPTITRLNEVTIHAVEAS